LGGEWFVPVIKNRGLGSYTEGASIRGTRKKKSESTSETKAGSRSVYLEEEKKGEKWKKKPTRKIKESARRVGVPKRPGGGGGG